MLAIFEPMTFHMEKMYTVNELWSFINFTLYDTNSNPSILDKSAVKHSPNALWNTVDQSWSPKLSNSEYWMIVQILVIFLWEKIPMNWDKLSKKLNYPSTSRACPYFGFIDNISSFGLKAFQKVVNFEIFVIFYACMYCCHKQQSLISV